MDKEAEFPHKTKISKDNVKYHLFDCVKDLRNLERVKMVPISFPEAYIIYYIFDFLVEGSSSKGKGQ